MAKKLYTLSQAADILGVTSGYLRQMVALHRIRTKRVRMEFGRGYHLVSEDTIAEIQERLDRQPDKQKQRRVGSRTE